ncbi:MAG: hypothetical protein Q7R52_02945 [archaeon]|nr:hypothetical protein [archaeon]
MKTKEFPYFVDEKKHEFYFLGNSQCQYCNKILDNVVKVRVLEFRKKLPLIQHYCFKCVNKMENDKISAFAIREQRLNFICVKKKPKKADIAELKIPTLVPVKNIDSVFDAAVTQIDREESINKTQIAGRESWRDAIVGDKKYEIEDKS